MLNIIGTPIGNLDDISYRQARVLNSSDIILAEDTRSAMNLLSRTKSLLQSDEDLPLRKKPNVMSYYKDVEMLKLPLVMKWLKEEKIVSLISEAGMPLISDPGYLLVKACIREDIAFTVIPGPSAVITAIIYSGFQCDEFMFLGFLPKKQNDLIRVFEKVRTVQSSFPKTVFVAFESPKRIQKTLEYLKTILPNAQIVIARELTKKFEEILRGTTSVLKNTELKGEITLVIGPST
ncbi:MAG: Ribosomal RNA small subunit methyltransferase I [Candidatus Roizmanbacteria bacterium GW2011_GWA2_37_7]|uniref:Ribosomal RNA small subunit methyltransferase I n=1 Tax=Candidatus Roizmanbacteria bacterium GW2011_GWA2_37_7 TaxID=1618481 RepID=A0A0G0H3M5_9BACT|nr:MAG: Ribosomal RNA small subunit methyltransferase I [Candidatus Roizmanbacteria bacterium GW2011_GWA2_37_7]